MQNQNHTTLDDKFAMNFGAFDPDNLFNPTHMSNMGVGMKRSAHDAGLDRDSIGGVSSDDDSDFMKKEGGLNASSSTRENIMQNQQTSVDQTQKQNMLPNGKKTKGRVKIKMEFIDNKLRRYTTFSKRKTGIMKKAYELSTLTGTQVMLLVASETGHVYTFATRKLQPMITSEAGKALIQTCLNNPDPPSSHQYHHHDQRMSATGYEETELTYAVPDDDNTKVCACTEHRCRQLLRVGTL
uniref:Serum response factor homolog n=2 Tax=Hirondellea gigas TaxID=1518452 RepID=A0A2P2IBQ8_9CRUS